MKLADLAPVLGGQRQAYLSAWRGAARPVVPASEAARAEEFLAALEAELDRLQHAASPALVEAALSATAEETAKRGLSLGGLLAVSACGTQAASAALGDEASPALVRALGELGALRASAYVRAYATAVEEARPRCLRPLVATERTRPASATHGLVGASPAMQRVRRAIEAAARGPSTILVTGESGSGKELVARAIHAAAGSGRFVAVNCAALPSHLVESELFGHVRGAFTGAAEEHVGLFRAAEGGTLFLDEITEMSPEMQAKLLRVLEERKVRPVGSLKESPIELRVIASTNREVTEAVRSGRLRADLFYRLQSFGVPVPPLRERASDIPLLAEHFLASFCSRKCGCIWAISDAAMDLLMAAEWPGNVRELRNALEHAVTTGQSSVISPADLPELLLGASRAVARRETRPALALPTLEEAELALIRSTLEHCDGNKLRAAASLGISRHKLYDRLRRLEGAES